MAILDIEKLAIRIGDKLICRDLSIRLNSGELLGILGRSGVGKTTFLHTLMGFHRQQAGTIRIQDQDLQSIPRHQLAKQIGLLFQQSESNMPATVLETVLLGRHPYSENLLWDSAEDVALCRETLKLLGLGQVEDRQVSTLSGGEKQRVAIALLLAQNPKVSLLDEPSNHLDIDYQIKILNHLTEKSKTQNTSMVLASHEINLISRFCDQVLLLLGDGEVLCGRTQEIMTTDNLELAFGCNVEHVMINERDYFLPG